MEHVWNGIQKRDDLLKKLRYDIASYTLHYLALKPDDGLDDLIQIVNNCYDLVDKVENYESEVILDDGGG